MPAANGNAIPVSEYVQVSVQISMGIQKGEALTIFQAYLLGLRGQL